jgi:AAA domain, putative AbiEii toxin, Type IV TA system
LPYIRNTTPEQEANVSFLFDGLASQDRECGFRILPDGHTRVFSPTTADLNQVLPPVFIPPKEVLSFFPGLGSLTRKYQVNFDLTYLNLLDALELPPLRELSPQIEALIKNTLQPILGGRLALEGGRFYLIADDEKRLEINLAAEGIRKFGMLAQLLNNGSLTTETTLYWDEPEANLNPALLRKLAALLATLVRQGFQIILATHSLFLLKELHILAKREPTPVRYFGLFAGPAGDTQVETTDDFELLQHLTALDAELEQTVDFEQALTADDADAD